MKYELIGENDIKIKFSIKINKNQFMINNYIEILNLNIYTKISIVEFIYNWCTHHNWIVAIGKDVQQIGRGYKVETGEGQSLSLQVFGESFLAQHQVLLNGVQPFVEVGSIGGLHHVNVRGNFFNEGL